MVRKQATDKHSSQKEKYMKALGFILNAERGMKRVVANLRQAHSKMSTVDRVQFSSLVERGIDLEAKINKWTE